jgi:carbamoyl-phosphate synthase small subunit
MKLATLVLDDGTVIEGQAFGAETDAVFELVFTTSMTGYQEILTNPSYRGQGVLFTVSHMATWGSIWRTMNRQSLGFLRP